MKNTKFSQDIYRLERILRDEFSWKQALICFESLKPAVIKSDERVDKLDNTNVCITVFTRLVLIISAAGVPGDNIRTLKTLLKTKSSCRVIAEHFPSRSGS